MSLSWVLETIEIAVKEGQVTVRDYGRGIPLGKVVDVVSRMNTGGKYDTRAFKKSVGLNGVGTKAVNALSTYFKVESIRDDQSKVAVFERGELTKTLHKNRAANAKVHLCLLCQTKAFKHFRYRHEYIVRMLKNYVYLNPGLTIVFNGEKYKSKDKFKNLLEDNNNAEDMLYPIIHLRGNDIEVAITHSKTQYSEEYHSFVNGQHTTQGGTHQSAFREAIVKTFENTMAKVLTHLIF